MGNIVVVENISLDGVMQGPASADEDPRDGFSRGGWATELLAADPDAAGAAMRDQPAAEAMLFGRRTYFDVVGHWLSVGEPNPFTSVLRGVKKYVATRNDGLELPYPNTERVGSPMLDGVRALLDGTDGDIVVLGSGDLVRQLAAAGLVDRYLLTILPVGLGSGRRLFDSTPAAFDVENGSVSPTGIMTATYRVRR